VYFDMSAYLEWKQGQPASAVADVATAAVTASYAVVTYQSSEGFYRRERT
jgi:hypothetical protein